jgi:hypothetical protein
VVRRKHRALKNELENSHIRIMHAFRLKEGTSEAGPLGEIMPEPVESFPGSRF